MQSAQVIPFRFETREVRTVLIDDQPWFVAADVCAVLGYANSRKAITDNCRVSGVTTGDIRSDVANRDTRSRARRTQVMTLIDEGNLYRLIIKSRKEEAQRFEAWVCDEVLPAIRKQGRYEDADNRMATLVGQTIGTDGFHMLGAVVKGKVSSLSAAIQRRATAKIWSQTHAAFGVRSAADIPAEQLDSARNFIAAYALEGEWLPKQEPKQPRRLNIHFPVDALTCRRPEMLTIRNSSQAWLDVSLSDLREPFRSPCEAVLCELTREGYSVEGAWWELRTYRNKVESLLSAIRGLGVIAESPHRYAVKPNGENV
ncbi:Bro-N domain-containing protein [Pseudomonas sp. NPDC090755]|uniref:BRO-N domain-containing protein n=1 Tax=Pseudomonas sp. NPDC090755 TaxID=3364481 RepID=UPI00383AF871